MQHSPSTTLLTQKNKRNFGTIASRVSASPRRRHCRCRIPGQQERKLRRRIRHFSGDHHRSGAVVNPARLLLLPSQQPRRYWINGHETTGRSPLTALFHLFRESLYTVRHKKLHHFVFAITSSYLSLFEYLLVRIYRDKFGTNWHQNHQSHLKGVFILLCEMQHTCTCYDQRQFSHVGLNVITIVLNI